MPARSQSPVLFSRGSYLAVVFRRAPLAILISSKRARARQSRICGFGTVQPKRRRANRWHAAPGQNLPRGSIGCSPCPPSNVAARSFSSSASSSCFSSSSYFFFSPIFVLLRASLVAPKRPSYSFVRPNFYERLPAREFRNCLFSGTPGTSWSRPRRHREIESSGFSLPSSYLRLLPLFLPPSLLPWSSFDQPSRVSPYFCNRGRNVAKHEKRHYCENFVSRLISLKLHRDDVLDGGSLAATTLIKSRVKDVRTPQKLSMSDLRDARDIDRVASWPR